MINRNLESNPLKAPSNLARFLAFFTCLIIFAPFIFALSPVNLGTAGNFAILSQSGISTTGTTSIEGNIGVSPIAATAITGFGLIMDPSGQFSTSTLVNGKVYAADYAPPTPVNMGTAIGDMQTAYTDAAGRTLPDHTELGAGNIGGMTLAPGLYKWSSGVTIPTDVTLSGNSSAIWIFQVAGTLGISPATHVILAGGARANNIYWQVAGQTTLGTTSVFNGNILDQTAIVINTGATLNGRALAQTAVTLDANPITIPDTTAPMVAILSPNSSTFINNRTITVLFSANDTHLSTTNVSIYNASGSLVNSALNNSSSGSVQLLVPADGVYSIVATSSDLTGNSNSSTVNAITVDTTAPLLSISSPLGNSIYNSRTLSIIVSLTEANLDTARSNLTVANALGTIVNSTSLNGSGTYLLGVLANGTYSVTANAVDKVSLLNTSTKSNISVREFAILSNPANNVWAQFPAGTTITSNASWDGNMSGPTILFKANVTPSTPGLITHVSKIVEIGSAGHLLTFDRAVRLVVPGETGKIAGYTYDGSTFNVISTICTDNTQATNDLLAPGGNCYYDDGANLTIWTKHFTQFVFFTQNTLLSVNLGTAGNYAVLAKTGISTTGTTSIVGDIAVSPIAATAITGFGLIMDPSGQFSTSTLVTGRVYAADYAAPTPTVLTTAIGDMQTAYTDAAGRTLPNFTELGAGNIGGMTLTPGLYKWSSGVIIPSDVTLSGSSTDIWIFQVAGTLGTSSATHVLLSGGALADNIFWQVGGQATLGSTSVFNGNILDQTAVVLNTGATLNGRALAQTAVMTDGNPITKPVASANDTTPPVITILGSNPVNVTVNTTYTDAGATAFDTVSGNVTVFSSSTVNTAILGTYAVRYNATDAANNTAFANRTVNVVASVINDTTPPVITILGSNPVNVTQNTTYTDAGATALDAVSGNVTVFSASTVNTAIIGNYTVRYNATDASNNTAYANRTVRVVAPVVIDITPPVITVLGFNPISVIQNSTYTDAGATAFDAVSGVVLVTTTGTVNTALVGNYTLIYHATDAANNTATANRTVNVVASDTLPPVITILGSNPISVIQNTTYTDAGATALDAVSGVVAVTTTGTVNMSALGTYMLTYHATDAANNTATAVRVVIVMPDTIPPVITVLGTNPITILQNSTYIDAGATAIDAVSGVAVVNSSGALNTSVIGVFLVVYSATDSANNTAYAFRSVHVVADLTLTSVQLAVDLGSARHFVILAETGISTTGTTSINGNIGVSPIAATAITGFGLILDPSNQFATSSLVNGSVYAADYAAPTPSVMTTAIGDMQTAYTDAAGRTLPDYTELGAGNIGGMTLAPGLYKWNTGVTIPSDVTLFGNSTAVWIFQVAGTLGISPNKHVILSGGAKAENIVWQVAGQTTLGTTSVFNGNILDQTAIVINTGATLNGRAMAQSSVSLDSNPVASPNSPVVEILPPVITILGTNPTTVTQNTAYADAGASALDAVSGNTTVFASGTVDTSTIGVYVITYNSTDAANNTAIVTRTVNVVAAASTGSSNGGGSGGSSGGSGGSGGGEVFYHSSATGGITNTTPVQPVGTDNSTLPDNGQPVITTPATNHSTTPIVALPGSTNTDLPVSSPLLTIPPVLVAAALTPTGQLGASIAAMGAFIVQNIGLLLAIMMGALLLTLYALSRSKKRSKAA